MAFPQVEATNNSVQAASTTSHTVALPAGIQAGETLLVFITCDGTTVGYTFPAGWVELLDYGSIGVAWRKADGGEGASITVTTVDGEQSAHISYRISGATDPTATPPEVSAGVFGSDINPNPDPLTPTGGSKEYLWIAFEGNDDDDLVTVYPTNYTNGETYKSNTGLSTTAIGIARRELETDVEDPGAFTIEASEQWLACTVAVYPAEIVGWAGGNVLGVAIGTIAKINGVALADITKVNGIA